MVESSTTTAKPAAPNRGLINGRPSSVPLLHQSLADAAEAYIHMQQRSPCTNETKLLFARMDFHGIGNDVNMAVRALATAVIQDRQLVFLPPSMDDRRANSWMMSLGLDAERPWHWLAGAGLPHKALFVESACHKALTQRNVLRALAEAPETDPTAPLIRIGEVDLHRRARAWKPIWRVGLHAGVIPLPFRNHGLLWWFQVLSNYLVRVRMPLSQSIERNVAMREFLRPGGAGADSCRGDTGKNAVPFPIRHPVATHVSLGQCPRTPPEVGEAFGRHWCRKRWCDYIGPGWHPNVWFDVGLHLRLGDVCGKHATTRGQRARKCTDKPTEQAFALMRDHGLRGRVFIASDSPDAVATGIALGPAYGFNVSSLHFDRTLIAGSELVGNHSVGTEKGRRSQHRDNAVLIDSLMDALLLSRSNVLVGSMMSNFPRMALQLRIQAPLVGQQRYLSLDDRTWCTRTSCRMNYSGACPWPSLRTLHPGVLHPLAMRCCT